MNITDKMALKFEFTQKYSDAKSQISGGGGGGVSKTPPFLGGGRGVIKDTTFLMNITDKMALKFEFTQKYSDAKSQISRYTGKARFELSFLLLDRGVTMQ